MQANHDGEAAEDGQSQGDNQSVRPGSIVSNIEQRLDEIEGLGPAEPEEMSGASSAKGAQGGSSSQDAAAEAQYYHLLQEMQHRDLTPADLQLLKMLEQERAQRHSGGAVPCWSAAGSSSSQWPDGGASWTSSSSCGAGPSSWVGSDQKQWGGGHGEPRWGSGGASGSSGPP